MDTDRKSQNPRLVKVGRHLLPCISANDYLTLGERRWHSLHTRAQEMLEDARADSAQRVSVLSAVYAQRDSTASLAIQSASTLDGAMEIIALALDKAKIEHGNTIDAMTPEELFDAAARLLGGDPSAESDPK